MLLPQGRKHRMAREYHNLQGWLRDVRKAIEAGEQLAYEVAEALIDLDELVDTDQPASGAGELQDGDPDADGGEGTDEETHPPGRRQQDDDAPTARMVRVAGSQHPAGQPVHGEVAASGRARSRPSERRAPVLGERGNGVTRRG